MLESAFGQIALILIVALVVGLGAKLAKQPLIVAYILVGIALGPSFFDVVHAEGEIELLAELGIAILLFLVGLKLDLGLIKSTGKVALFTGVGQVVITAVIGLLILLALGLDMVPALYVAVALAFSSTIIIVKLLSDRRELDQLHGQIAIGFLIVQDILVIVAMVVIVAIGSPEKAGETSLTLTLVGSVVFLLVIGLLTKFVLPRLLDWMAKSQELMLLFGVSWAVALAAVSTMLGLSMEIGAFLAGVSLASTPYRESLSARVASLRDVMLLFFFIQLGSSLAFADAIDQLVPAIVLSLFVLLATPVILMVIMRALGYRTRTSFKVGLAVAQISEFSLILIALGYSLGQVDKSVLSLVTLVGVITIVLSTYLILYSEQLYQFFAPYLGIFEPKGKRIVVDESAQQARYDAIIIGAGRLGGAVVDGMSKSDAKLLVVDQAPEALVTMRERGVSTLYGDITDPEFAHSLPLHEADAVICAVPERATNMFMLEVLERFEYEGQICLTAMDSATAKMLQENPKVTVIKPLKIAADTIVEQLPKLRERP